MKEWLEALDREYLGDYILEGGGCVKFTVGDRDATRTVCEELEAIADLHGFRFVELGAAQTRLNRSDEVFFEIARTIDWDELARAWVQTALNGGESAGNREVLREALLGLYRDYAMCQEFRLAMVQLCKAQVAGLENCAGAVRSWLCGELRRVSEIKPAKIFQKVGRQNARAMLQSLAYWLRLNGEAGLVLTIDIARCIENPKRLDRLPGFYYSSAALNEVYEVLRQLIDCASSLPGVLIAVTAPPEFLSDEKRGIDRYQALRMRIFDDMLNRGRQNVLAPLIRLEPGDRESEAA